MVCRRGLRLLAVGVAGVAVSGFVIIMVATELVVPVVAVVGDGSNKILKDQKQNSQRIHVLWRDQKSKTRHTWPAFVSKKTLSCHRMTIFSVDPYLWGPLGPPEPLGLPGLLWAPPGPPWDSRIKKKTISQGIHVS